MNAAFGEALIGRLPALRRYALSLARRADVADDLVQITVERAIAAADSYDPASRLDPWLFRITRNAFIDMTRRQRTRGIEVDVFDMPQALPTDGQRQIEGRLMLRATAAAMRTLPPEQREILSLVCVHELSYAEAAEILQIPTGTVMSRLSRARLALARKLGIE
ncbi:RNA polymerase sigma factor [Paracoccus salsus]|uniref:RNA polymerase sigma factor n=1 Tax=Paracoccus salsus TaxID=2911061 RepID=UPI001F356CAE|nr:RNA polymerase sigma factor [Paracoccus salsus]MCF3974275.1 RNA polymerase sigma factor [Paracoccus salsus]